MDGKTPVGFPLPGLLYFGFTRLLDLADDGSDKVAWSVPFAFKGEHFAFESRKFGLRLMCEPGKRQSANLRNVHGRARGLASIAREHLTAEHVDARLGSGDITIPNLFDELDARYRYFRTEALAHFDAAPELTAENVRSVDVAAYCRTLDAAAYLAGACIEAYFSRIDHLLMLALGFLGDVVAQGKLVDFLRSPWGEKVCEIVSPYDNPPLANVYDRLVMVRQTWRNPAAHGGMRTKGASFYFHVDGVGVLPVDLTAVGTPTIAMPQGEFSEVLGYFDEFDRMLRKGKLREVWQWAEAGLDVAVDDRSRTLVRAAMTTSEDFASYLEGVARQRDIDDNMDF